MGTIGRRGIIFLLSGVAATGILSGCWPRATADPGRQATPTATPAPAPASMTPVPQTPTVPLPWATPGGPTPTPLPAALSNEISEAYLHFWKIRSDAAYDLNPELLPQVLAGEQLVRERQEIDRLRSQGQAAVTLVDHRFQPVLVDQGRVLIFDEYRSRSYVVDASTRLPPGPTPEAHRQVRVAFEMQKMDGIWKVTDSERFEE
jgi:hypothetical protein